MLSLQASFQQHNVSSLTDSRQLALSPYMAGAAHTKLGTMLGNNLARFLQHASYLFTITIVTLAGISPKYYSDDS